MGFRVMFTALVATAAFAIPATAQAEYTVELRGTRVSNGTPDPGSPNTCTAIVFYRWNHQPGTITAKVTWKYANGTRGSIKAGPPYSDKFAAFPTEKGQHQLEAGYFRSLGDGSLCKDKVKEIEASLPPTATVILTVKGSPKCDRYTKLFESLQDRAGDQRQALSFASDFAKTLGQVRSTGREQAARLKARNETDALDDLQKALGRLSGRKPSRPAMTDAIGAFREQVADLKANKPGPSLEVLRQRSREAREMQRAVDALSALRIGKKTAKKRLKSTLERRRDAARKRARAC